MCKSEKIKQMQDEQSTDIQRSNFCTFINHAEQFDVIELKDSEIVILIEKNRLTIYPDWNSLHQDEFNNIVSVKLN